MFDNEWSMFLKRSDRASCGACGTKGMLRSDEYEGGALWSCGGCGVPKSRGAGDEDLECTDRDVSSFMRFVLRTWRKRSVISWASLSTSAASALEAACDRSMASVPNGGRDGLVVVCSRWELWVEETRWEASSDRVEGCDRDSGEHSPDDAATAGAAGTGSAAWYSRKQSQPLAMQQFAATTSPQQRLCSRLWKMQKGEDGGRFAGNDAEARLTALRGLPLCGLAPLLAFLLPRK